MARVLITGSTDGLGLMAAKRLADQGHKVTVHARNEGRAAAVRKAMPATESVVVGDLSSLAGTRQVAAHVRMPEMTGMDFRTRLGIDNPAQAGRVVLMSDGFTRRPGDPPIALPSMLLEKPFEIEQVMTLMREAMQREPLGLT